MRTCAPVPPKGWNSWDAYGAAVTEREVRQNAEVMAAKLKPLGWEYIVVDIQWYEPAANSSTYHHFYPLMMDEYSRLMPAPNRFPSAKDGNGFRPLAAYVHSLGLKFGIHIMRGIPREAVHKNMPIKGTTKTAREIALNNICPWNSDMYGVNMDIPEGQLYYDSLIELYASWGVDFLKVDDIADSKIYHSAHRKEIAGIRKAIDKIGRPIVLSLSPGPAHLEDGAFLQRNANMWRLTDDFWDTWRQLKQMFDKCEQWAPFVRKGNWPDCDMLPLGHIGIRSVDGPGGDRYTRFTQAEQRTMMTLWTLFQSPLIYGGELKDLDDFTLSLLTNRYVMNMTDSLVARSQIFRDDHWVVWEGNSETDRYFAIFNVSEESLTVPEDLADRILADHPYQDLWQGSAFDRQAVIAPHDCVLLQLGLAGESG